MADLAPEQAPQTPGPLPEQNALISAFDKSGLEEFAGQIHDLGWNLYGSEGTARRLNQAGIETTDVAELVGGNPILGHRVVTLSREVFAGLLADPNKPEDVAELNSLGIPIIGMVRVDMYPLEQEIAKPDATELDIIEKTDIGGPTLLRAAAKGRRIAISASEQQQMVVDWLKAGRPDEDEFLHELAARAEYEVTRYTMASTLYLGGTSVSGYIARQHAPTKYGENAHQTPAGFYSDNRVDIDPLGLDQFEHRKGWELSYVNETDIDASLQTLTHIAAGFERSFGEVPPMAVGVKHGNACGAGVAETHAEAVIKMLEGNTLSIHGGVVMINGVIDAEIADLLMRHAMPENGGNRLLDGVIGAEVTDEAVEILNRAKLRIVTNPALGSLNESSLDQKRRTRYVRGGVLEQPNYTAVLDVENEDYDTFGDALSEQQKRDLVLAWAVGSTSNSNTITLVKDGKLIGNGVGQQDRVGAGQLAISRTTIEPPEILDDLNDEELLMVTRLDREKLYGAVAYSDSFFPFPDGPELLAEAGVKAIFTTYNTDRHLGILAGIASKGVSIVAAPDAEMRGFAKH